MGYTIYWFDPGRTTGVAELYVGDGPAAWGARTWTLGPQEHHRALYVALETVSNIDYVGYESFQYRHHLTKADLIPVEYIGVIKLWSADYHRPVYSQTPAQGKGFWLKKLEALGQYKGKTAHERDALAHALYFLFKTMRDPRVLWGLRETHPE